MKNFKKYSLFFTIGAIGYAAIEIIWRGFTHWSMMIAGGLCFVLFSFVEEMLKEKEMTFSEALLDWLIRKDLKDSDVYKKANIDRKLFSKIRKDVHYKPSKTTAIAFAISLELSLEETEDMLRKAGFALSHSNKFDIIIEYFISRGNYKIFEINEALFAFDQSLLGA